MPLSVIEADIQALRTLVQTQQSQLKTLQALKESQPLVGLTTDSPWGMALEGLVLGLVALAFGALLLVGARTVLPSRLVKGPMFRPKPVPATEFSDSMLYLVDREGAADSVTGVSSHLHDPLQDAKASTLAHEDGDSELDYYRMALTAQGLSVTAGAGHVDSDRVPLESAFPAASAEKVAGSVFSPTLSKVEFDQRAAAEEVERVRRYLAQRRADRAKNSPMSDMAMPSAPAAADHEELQAAGAPLSVDIPLDVEFPSEPVATLPPEKGADTATGTQTPLAADPGLEHMSLADGASLLVALEDAGQLAPAEVGPQALVADGAMLEWDPSLLVDAKLPSRDAVEEAEPPPLLGAPVQLALAQEFRDLGLWEEARARVLEVLEQPDTGHHAQAQALLEELAQTASAPLAPSPDSEDPWGH